MMNSLREELQRVPERCICPVWRELIGPVNAPKGRGHESEPYNSSPRAGGVFHVHDDALYHAPPRGTEYFDDIRALQLSEEMQVRISRWIFDNNERGEMLDQTKIERLRDLPRLRMEQRTAAVALQSAPSRRRGEPDA